MCEHQHNHEGGGCDHSLEEDLTSDFNLYIKVDIDSVECLNEVEEGSGKVVFKAWDERLSRDKFIESDCDPELLINIPFTGNVKLKKIAIFGGEHDTHPKQMKLYKNIPGMSLDQAQKAADQSFDLPCGYNDIIQLPLKIARFSSVSHLTLHFPENHGAETTKIYYIGLSGDFTPAPRQPILLATYELSANPADHKTKLFQTNNSLID